MVAKSRRRAARAVKAGGDRLPPIPLAKQTDAQREAAREIAAGPRGALLGPFAAALRSPEYVTLLQRLGEYLRYRNAIGPRLTELVILLTARAFTQQFEWDVHVSLAAEQGISQDVIDAIAQARRPDRLTGADAVVYDFFMELASVKSVSDATYARAVEALGEQGVVDLVGVAGYYATLAMLMNVARTPLPRGHTPQLVPLPFA